MFVVERILVIVVNAWLKAEGTDDPTATIAKIRSTVINRN